MVSAMCPFLCNARIPAKFSFPRFIMCDSRTVLRTHSLSFAFHELHYDNTNSIIWIRGASSFSHFTIDAARTASSTFHEPHHLNSWRLLFSTLYHLHFTNCIMYIRSMRTLWSVFVVPPFSHTLHLHFTNCIIYISQIASFAFAAPLVFHTLSSVFHEIHHQDHQKHVSVYLSIYTYV